MKLFLLVALFYFANAQNCPPGLDLAMCFAPPCLTESCPRFPDAQCTDDFCGGCNAIFSNATTGEVIPRFACEPGSNFPDCLSSVFCSRPRFDCATGCPRVPDAVCSLTCDCSLVFTDRRTGATLSGEECGRDFDERCPPFRFSGFGTCDVCSRKCPEEQICCPNGCFGSPMGSSCIPTPVPRVTCRRIGGRRSFRSSCSDGNNEGSECQLSCTNNRFLIGAKDIICQSNGEWSSDLDGISCIREREFDSRCPAVQPIRPANCPVCPTRCPRGQICCPTGCPGASSCISPPTVRPRPQRTNTPAIQSRLGSRSGSTQCQRKSIPQMRYFCRTNSITNVYFCSLRCNSGYTLNGSSIVRCVNGRFEPSLDNMSCDRRTGSVYRSCTTCG